MNIRTILLLVAVVVLGASGWWYAHVHQAPSALTQASGIAVVGKATTSPASGGSATDEASSSDDIPGENLTLGEDGTASTGKYLIGYNGRALYTYDKDSTNVSRCTGSCATTWPPYIVTTSSDLVGEYPINGAISTIPRADGSLQVTYNGKPLYFYAKDGDTGAAGTGVADWSVARP